jgi:N-dimethylarginine dimethylaminohydrolase
MQLHLRDETAPLISVLIGRADQMGSLPSLTDLYDPKSKAHLLAGTYPKEADLIAEINALKNVLEKHGVKVFQPDLLKDCNQIFARDLGFVIDDLFVQSNILPLREKELEGLKSLYTQFDSKQIIRLHEEAHVEGGDVMLFGDHLFVGVCTRFDYSEIITARTNTKAIEELQRVFPHKKIYPIELRKSEDPCQNALHLDCIFQPLGHDFAIFHPDGFSNPADYKALRTFFKPENCFEITAVEMYEMNSNIFSIAPDIVVSDPSYDRLNQWLTDKGITVEEVSYREVAKQEGLFRCSTLPLQRQKT